LGVAVSSWIFQNTLLMRLFSAMTAPSAELKQAIIRKVRESIAAIASLDEEYKAEVITAYAGALRWTLGSGIIVALAVLVLTIPVKLPDLPGRDTRQKNSATQEDTQRRQGVP
jgi:hypothetical protein